MLNHALIRRNLENTELDAIEKFFKSEKKKPILYFENKLELKKLKKLLIGRGYKEHWEESWMFHTGEGMEELKAPNIRKVRTDNELNTFLTTFNNCYRKGDPQNPYGELGDHLNIARESWERHHENGKVEYFIAFQGSKPVAVTALTNFSGMGYISHGGSLLEVRGKGFGKLLNFYCLHKSLRNGNKLHFLVTLKGQYVQKFCNRLGYTTKLTAVGFVKE
ncbi:hypothetical protein A2716_04220 [candidate division WWE3 bacterium RIFCSPHIGHO2_01_FULL_40_23]|uniref:N-acetyltransferase domain-containing protein n=1 Tax=candidate division WWE3 bacterium RIFCSPLOWO2_01_FULL_41_18 TaxID=1802625 RepID=A0A1F4VDQ8_UNCKA|nr:MAG: hypothetical protein A2716_04220 [candidate division WWE3 bacterium RIFCSPHIGHO2_01_FULL_40_23]OGC55080.1 MAG: hypothetical protein A3A78_03830 [candidate division WWE3 bacterium RIFCSPLOWO2_01_FULL_41_18]